VWPQVQICVGGIPLEKVLASVHYVTLRHLERAARKIVEFRTFGQTMVHENASAFLLAAELKNLRVRQRAKRWFKSGQTMIQVTQKGKKERVFGDE
jgi:hypothetical protein